MKSSLLVHGLGTKVAQGKAFGEPSVAKGVLINPLDTESTAIRLSGSCVCDGGMDCCPDRGAKVPPPTKAQGTCRSACYGIERGVKTLLGAVFGKKYKAPTLAAVMAFQFDPLVHRMVDKYGWDEPSAREAFEDLKRYMWLCVSTGKPLVPSATIDELWHNFILFTMDYEEFCLTVLGRFLHHRPRRRDDPKGNEGDVSPVGMTLKLATKAFGPLSKHWEFPGVKVEAGCTCSNWCQCS